MKTYQEDEINVYEYWVLLKKYKKFIAGSVGLVTIVTAIISLVMPAYYKVGVVIMPVGGNRGGLAGQLGGLAAIVGLGGGGGPTASQKLMTLLQSRTLAERVVDRYDLTSVFAEKFSKGKSLKKEEAVGLLRDSVKFDEDSLKSGTIRISAEFKNPNVAADIANGYPEALREYVNENTLTSAKHDRVFIEQQLANNKRELLETGLGLNEFYKSGKVSSVESKVDVPIEELSVQHAELAGLQKQLADIETKMVVKGVPQQVYLQYLTLQRNVLTQVNSLLTQQYEMAKIEESKNDLVFQVIDSAQVPEKRSRPKRKQMVMMAFVG